MEIDTDNYDSLPREQVPKDEPARSSYLSEQNVAMRQTLSLIFSRYPEVEKSFTSFQRQNARPVYAIKDAAGTMHWTFINPQSMGS